MFQTPMVCASDMSTFAIDGGGLLSGFFTEFPRKGRKGPITILSSSWFGDRFHLVLLIMGPVAN